MSGAGPTAATDDVKTTRSRPARSASAMTTRVAVTFAATSRSREARRLVDKRLPLPAYDQILKANHAFNLLDDGLVGQQLFAGEATRLAYLTDEAVEGRDAFLQKRDPDWSPYPWHY